MNDIWLRPDPNRPKLESEEYKKLSSGILIDSLTRTKNLWEDRIPRVSLIVPHYTRIIKPLDVIISNSLHKNYHQETINTMRDLGINDLEEMKRAGTPVGLMRIGTPIKKAGYTVQIIDAVYEGWDNDKYYFTAEDGSIINRYGLDIADLEKRIIEQDPDIVGITVPYSHQWGNAREVADLVKKIDSRIVTVMGGTHVSRPFGMTQDALIDSPTDYVVSKQSDIAFIELSDFLTGKSDKNIDDIDGLTYRKNGRIIDNKSREFAKASNSILSPDYSLINMNLYSEEKHSSGLRQTNNGYNVAVFTGFGCDIACKFCTITYNQGTLFNFPIHTVDTFFKNLNNLGVREFLLENDHFLGDPLNVLTISDIIKNYGMPWYEEGGFALFSLIGLLPNVTEGEIRNSSKKPNTYEKLIEAKRQGITTEYLIKKLAESGCYGGYLAVESANKESLSGSNKPTLNVNQKDTIEIIKMFKKYNMDITVGLMLGFIENSKKGLHIEQISDIEKTIQYGKLLKDNGAAFINPFIVTPLPGAPNYLELKNYALRNTDIGYSHEFGTMNAHNEEWNVDDMNLLRTKTLLYTNGTESFMRMRKIGTWPVG